MKAIRVHETGGPEVLVHQDIPTPDPGEGQVRVKMAAAGLNYIDTYHRTGLYPMDLPMTPGLEGAGTVDAVGPGVTEVKVGDQVAFSAAIGAYAEYNLVTPDKLVPVPDGVDLAQAAAVMLQGMTAHYLAYSVCPLNDSSSVLVHAAAGGTGQLLIQLLKKIGVTVIGTVSTAEKEQLARAAGADHIIRYTEADFEEETKRLTDGKGVNVVYDSVGQTTFEKSLKVLQPRGYLVLFGQSSGPVQSFNPALLAQGGSLFLTRPSLFNYIATREDLLQRSGDLFQWMSKGELSLRIDRQMPLAEAAEAHRLLQARQTAGKVLLIP